MLIERWRYRVVLAGLLLIVLGLIWRMVDLMIFDRAFLLGQGDARSIRTLEIPAYRGMITDRNGVPLAVSTPVDSVWLDPKEFSTNTTNLSQLSSLIGVSLQDINSLYTKNQKKEFVYLKRGLSPFIGDQVKALDIPGIYIQSEFHRFYPNGEVVAQLVGLTNIDDQGQEGEELAYNKWLSGSSGKKRILQDRLGHVVANLGVIQQPVAGNNLTLSIDERIQYIAYRELAEAVQNSNAEAGSIVVLDTRTNEVLAMVNSPSYNPNDRPTIHDGRYRNRAVTDVFEPGSTAKAFSVSNGLMSGKYTPNTIIDTRPGYIIVQNREIDDDDDYGILTVTGVLQQSSNVGVTKITLSLDDQDSLWTLLHAAGFGQITDSGFPGESPGVLIHRHPWRPLALATMAFGYGFNVTDLQIAQAYSILANGGIKKPITLLKVDNPPQGIRVMPANIAYTVLSMMRSVVEKGGTGTRAQIPGYTVSGKTGTARMVGAHGYELNHHTSVFVGVAPATNPRLVCAVVLKDPQGAYYGGLVAAPVFSKVVGDALRILNIPPDDSTTEEPVADVKSGTK